MTLIDPNRKQPPGQEKMNPGDEALPGTPATGEAPCPECGGSGKLEDSRPCPNCGGSGRIVQGVGGA